jgi:hypothetical protein
MEPMKACRYHCWVEDCSPEAEGIESVTPDLWPHKFDTGCVNPQQRYLCRLDLCLELGFYTGQRISNFTHRRSLSHEDHCIPTNHISFVFSPSNLYPGTPMLKACPLSVSLCQSTIHHSPVCITWLFSRSSSLQPQTDSNQEGSGLTHFVEGMQRSQNHHRGITLPFNEKEISSLSPSERGVIGDKI